LATKSYFIIGATNAAQPEINSMLQRFDPKKGTVQPDVGDTSVSGGMWMGYDLSPDEVQSISTRKDILLIMTQSDASMFPTLPRATSQSVATAVSLVTLATSESKTTLTSLPTSSDLVIIIDRRHDVPSQPPAPSQTQRVLPTGGRLRDRTQRFAKNNVEDNHPRKRKSSSALGRRTVVEKRDPGSRLVRQIGSPKDLAVLAWAKGVPSVDNVDYIFEETKGENTWVYVVDSGVADDHWVSLQRLFSSCRT